MSTYCKKLTNPRTGKKQVALCLDDYYGEHKYAYVFKKDGSDITLDDNLDTRTLEFYPEGKIAEFKK